MTNDVLGQCELFEEVQVGGERWERHLLWPYISVMAKHIIIIMLHSFSGRRSVEKFERSVLHILHPSESCLWRVALELPSYGCWGKEGVYTPVLIKFSSIHFLLLICVWAMGAAVTTSSSSREHWAWERPAKRLAREQVTVSVLEPLHSRTWNIT